MVTVCAQGAILVEKIRCTRVIATFELELGILIECFNLLCANLHREKADQVCGRGPIPEKRRGYTIIAQCKCRLKAMMLRTKQMLKGPKYTSERPEMQKRGNQLYSKISKPDIGREAFEGYTACRCEALAQAPDSVKS